jgi:hypothetical protein
LVLVQEVQIPIPGEVFHNEVRYTGLHERKQEMDSERMTGSVKEWKGGDPRSPDHPHQMWLRADTEDERKCAFLAARPDLSEAMLEAVTKFQDTAQYHFITRLIFNQGHGVYDTEEQAFASALHVHQTAMPMPKVIPCSRW